jgi:hypothetical protein
MISPTAIRITGDGSGLTVKVDVSVGVSVSVDVALGAGVSVEAGLGVLVAVSGRVGVGWMPSREGADCDPGAQAMRTVSSRRKGKDRRRMLMEPLL